MLIIENQRQLVLADITDDQDIVIVNTFFDYLDDTSDEAVIPNLESVFELDFWLENYWHNNTPNDLESVYPYPKIEVSDYLNSKIEKFFVKNYNEKDVPRYIIYYLKIHRDLHSYKAAINRITDFSATLDSENPITEKMLYGKMIPISFYQIPEDYIADAIQRGVITYPYSLYLNNTSHLSLIAKQPAAIQHEFIRTIITIKEAKLQKRNLDRFFDTLMKDNSSNVEYAISYFLENRKEITDVHYDYVLALYLSAHTQEATIKSQLITLDLVIAVLSTPAKLIDNYDYNYEHTDKSISFNDAVLYISKHVDAVQYLYAHTPEKVDTIVCLYLEKYYHLGYENQLTKHISYNQRYSEKDFTYYCTLIDYLEDIYKTESVKYIILALNNPNTNKLTEKSTKGTIESMFFLLNKYVGTPEFGEDKQVLLFSLLENEASLIRKLALPLCAKYPELAKQVATELLLHKKKDIRTTAQELVDILQ